MEIQISQKQVSLTDAQVGYLQEKIGKAIRAGGSIDDESTQVKINVSLLKIKAEENVAVEVTIWTKGAVVRAEEQALTLEAAVDLTEEKLRKQMRRYKERYKKRRREERWIPAVELQEDIPRDEYEPQIAKRKRFSNSKPLHEEEAIEHMELSGHDFFLFNNLETGRWSTVYRRKDGKYGIVEPKMGDEE